MRLRIIISSITMPVLIAGLVGGVALAAPSTVYVGKTNCSDLGPGTMNHPYCTVQKGVTSVANGGTVKISNGTYSEQVTIPSGKNNITLKGNGNNTTIQAPATLTAGGIIVDNNAKGLTITDLSVSGPFQAAGCNDNEYGVYFENGSSGTISDSRVVNIEDANVALRGCQQGVAIRAGQHSTSNVASIKVVGSTVTGYQKGGIVVDNAGSNGIIERNTITGYGPVNYIAQNGIQISRGATATVNQNNVQGNEYTGGATTAAGILIYDTNSKSTFDQNSTPKNDIGIDVEGSSNGTYSQNTSNNNTTNGIFVEDDNYTNPTPTILSQHNSFTQNSAHSNTGTTFYIPYDVQDTTTGSGSQGTANSWHRNDCKTSSPSDLCED